jgi:hypothetical protein
MLNDQEQLSHLEQDLILEAYQKAVNERRQALKKLKSKNSIEVKFYFSILQKVDLVVTHEKKSH